MENTRRRILLDKEKEWCLKIHALWLQSEDENTKFFHNFSNFQKSIFTIYAIDGPNGTPTTTFEDIASTGVQHFHKIFKDSGATIKVILKIAYLFYRFNDMEGIEQTMSTITKE